MGHGVEIGEGGLSFSMGQNLLAEGKRLVLNFQVPGRAFVSVQGEVRNATVDSKAGQFRFGISFSTLKFEHKREIRAYVSARQDFEN